MQENRRNIPGPTIIATDNTMQQHASDKTSKHLGKSLGTIFSKLGAGTVAEHPDPMDVPLMNMHLKLNHMLVEELQRLSNHAKFRQLMDSIKH